MVKILKFLNILQEVSNRDRIIKLGRGFSTATRFNPYNPLSYITILLIIVIGILMYGFVGLWQKSHFPHPFKWD